jgi:DNA invertase Pin-like site-specific DNA recombinase
VSTIGQSGDRFLLDSDKYDLTLLDKVSGTVAFRDRQKAKELIQLVETNKVTEVIVEELSRLGRSTGDCLRTLEWLEEMGINVVVRNLGLQSRPNGKINPIWKMITSVLTSIYDMELSHIKQRTLAGKMMFLQKGGRLGRPNGTTESVRDFLEKEKSKEIAKNLKKGLSVRQVSKIVDCSSRTVLKVKKHLKLA